MSGQNTLLVIAEDAQVKRPSHKWNWQMYRDTAIPGAGTYKAMDMNGVIEIIGGPGVAPPLPIVPQLFANALFVDAVFGNDNFAAPFSLMDSITNPTVHKYQTITTALAFANPGDVIIVYPGDYTENANLYADGITYYFYPDANVSRLDGGAIFENTTQLAFCKVEGYGNFFSVGNSGTRNGSVADIRNGRFQMRANDLTSTAKTIRVQDGNTEFYVRNIFSSADANIFATGTLDPNSTCLIKVEKDIETTSATVNSRENIVVANFGGAGSYLGKITIYCDRILGSPNWIAPTGLELMRLGGNIGVLGNETEVNVFARQMIYRAAAVLTPDDTLPRACVGVTTSQNMNVKIYGDIISLRQNGIAFRANTAPVRLDFTGNIFCVDHPATRMRDSGYLNIVDGTLRSNNTADGVSKVNEDSITEFNGKVQNTSVAGIGINKESLASLVLINDLKVVTGGGASLFAPVADVYRAIWALATNTVHPTMTNAILAGPVDYTDALVV